MKKFFLMAVMAVAALSASAQKGEFHVTPHISLGYAHLSDATTENGVFDLSDNLLGGIGADLEYMISNSFGVSAGLDYNYIQSSKESGSLGNQSGELYCNYSFLNIPILVQYHFGTGFALKAGIQPMFLLEAKAHENETTGGGSKKQTESIKDEFESTAFAIPVGISYTFETPITLDLRCNIPVSKLNKYDGIDQKMLGVTLSVGYRF